MMKSIRGAVAALTLAVPWSASAGPEDDSLVVAWGARSTIGNLDSYANNLRSGIWFSRMVWDQLVYRDPDTFEYRPLLALAWEQRSDTVWRFTLREGVQFHNGEPFDADDVVYTVNWIADPANGVMTQSNVSWIAGATKVDQYTVDIESKAPFPQALEFLSGPILIYPNEYYAEVGPEGMHDAPVGTGPMRVVSVKTAEEYMLERNPGYDWGSPKGEAQVSRIVVREIADVETQVAELLGGGIDITADVTADHVENIDRLDGFAATQAGTMRTGYLGFDVAGRGGPTPVNDIRIRQAVAHAVDREALVRGLIRGDAAVVHTPCYPTQFGCDAAAATIYDHDPEKSRTLLREAGYPDGFDIEFYTFRPAAWAEAIIGDLAEVGIRAQLLRMRYPAMRTLQREHGTTPLFLSDWGSYSINDMSAITSQFFTLGPDDFARDEELAGWLGIADTSTDTAIRRDNYAKAIARITDRLYWLPLFNHVRNYAYRDELDFTAYADEVPRFWQYGWKD